jgi:hypothetical protein
LFLYLSSFLFYCWRPFSLWWESIKKFLLHGAQRALANGDNAFVHNTVDHNMQCLIISVLLGYSARQTNSSESIISLPHHKQQNPTVTFSYSRSAHRETIGRLTLANCSFRLENRKDTSRQTVNQIDSISWCAGIIRMFHIREMWLLYIQNHILM